MKRILKYPVQIYGSGVIDEHEDSFFVEMRLGYRLLDVNMQDGLLCFWAMVDEDAPPVKVKAYIKGTGASFAETFDLDSHVKTVHDTERGYVWHIFVQSGQHEIVTSIPFMAKVDRYSLVGK